MRELLGLFPGRFFFSFLYPGGFPLRVNRLGGGRREPRFGGTRDETQKRNESEVGTFASGEGRCDGSGRGKNNPGFRPRRSPGASQFSVAVKKRRGEAHPERTR